MSDDPFAPPTQEGELAPVFALEQIAVASLLCSPVAASLLLLANARALGRSVAWTAAASGAWTAAALAFTFLTPPDTVSRSSIAILAAAGMWALADRLHGREVRARLASGARRSWATALGIAFATAAIGLVVGFALLMGLFATGHSPVPD